MSKFIALAASGVAYGAIVAIVALGFVFLYKATGIINFAHGDLMTAGGFIAIWAQSDLGAPPVLAYLIAIVALFVGGVLLERVAAAPLRGRPRTVVIIATLAAALAIRSALSIWQGGDPKRLETPVGTSVVTMFGANVAAQRIVVVVVAAIVIGTMFLVFQRTQFGRSVRAMAFDREAAELQGIRVRRTSMLAFGISSALAAIAAVLVAPLSAVDLTFGFDTMVTAFVAAVLAGFGSLGGTVVAGVAMGLVDNLFGGYYFRSFHASLPFVLLLLVFAIRPAGLFGEAAGERL
jgi:branched-chain amino acid transport system permease protein